MKKILLILTTFVAISNAFYFPRMDVLGLNKCVHVAHDIIADVSLDAFTCQSESIRIKDRKVNILVTSGDNKVVFIDITYTRMTDEGFVWHYITDKYWKSWTQGIEPHTWVSENRLSFDLFMQQLMDSTHGID